MKQPIIKSGNTTIDFNIIEKQIQEIWDNLRDGKSIDHITIKAPKDIVAYYMHARGFDEYYKLLKDD